MRERPSGHTIPFAYQERSPFRRDGKEGCVELRETFLVCWYVHRLTEILLTSRLSRQGLVHLTVLNRDAREDKILYWKE